MKRNHSVHVGRNIWVRVDRRPNQHPQRRRPNRPARPTPLTPVKHWSAPVYHCPPPVPVASSYGWLLKPALYVAGFCIACKIIAAILTAILPFLILGAFGLVWSCFSGSSRR